MLFAPKHHAVKDDVQVFTGRGQCIAVTGRVLLVQLAADQTVGFQSLQAVGEQVAGNAAFKPIRDLFIGVVADHDAVQNEQRPFIADDIEGLGDIAVERLLLAHNVLLLIKS